MGTPLAIFHLELYQLKDRLCRNQLVIFRKTARENSMKDHNNLICFLGVVDSMVTKDNSQIVLLRGDTYVLQCLYYIIDRKLPEMQPSTNVM